MDIALQVDQARAEGLLGASESPAALGLDKYKSPLWLWRKLRGLHVDDAVPEAVREAAEWGQALEPVIRGKYALERNAVVYVPQESSIKDGWLRATPDGLVATEEHGRARGVTANLYDTVADAAALGIPIAGLVQIKCRSAWQRDAWSDGVPPAEEVQCRVEMAVCNLPWSDCVVLLGGNQMLVHRIERDATLEANILRDLRAFWDLVQSGREPEVDGSEAWRSYASEKMRSTKVTITADADMHMWAARWKAAWAARMKATAEEDAAKTQLLLTLSAAGAQAIDLGDAKISAYQTGARTAWKKYALSLGGTANPPEQFKGAPGQWTLRAPWGG